MIYDYTEQVYVSYCLSVAEDIKRQLANDADDLPDPEAIQWALRWEFEPLSNPVD